jgi:hypothetical protein
MAAKTRHKKLDYNHILFILLLGIEFIIICVMPIFVDSNKFKN